MTNKLGYEAMKQKIAALRKEILQLRSENARLRKSKTVEVKQVELPIKQAKKSDGKFCSCGLRLFNGKCMTCKKKNTPLSI
jgi:hypothetical protein